MTPPEQSTTRPLPELVLLLALNDTEAIPMSGRNRVDYALAAAQLAELMDLGAIEIEGDRVVAVDPLAVPTATRLSAAFAQATTGNTSLNHVLSRLKAGAEQQYAPGLVDVGLAEDTGWRIGGRKYQLLPAGVEARTRLVALLNGANLDGRMATLLEIVNGFGIGEAAGVIARPTAAPSEVSARSARIARAIDAVPAVLAAVL